MRLSIHALTLPLIALAMVVAACGDDDDSGTASTPEAAGTLAVVTTVPITNPTSDALQSALIEGADLPAGFAQTDAGLSGERALCGQPTEAFAADAVSGEASASFAAQDGGTLVIHYAIAAVDEAAAQASFGIVRDTLTGCESWTDANPGGGTTDWRRFDLAMPALGEEAVAFSASTTTQRPDGSTTVATFHASVVRRGRAASILFVLSDRPDASGLASSLASAADTRLAEAVPALP